MIASSLLILFLFPLYKILGKSPVDLHIILYIRIAFKKTFGEAPAMLEKFLSDAVPLLWGRGTIALTLICGLYFTVFTGFPPVLHPIFFIKNTFGTLFHKKSGRHISPFAAGSTALGGTMGVGNILGVGAAMALGGAGSIFWMWIGAFLGMMTKYTEVFLAVRWHEPDPRSHSFRGGPMYYMAKGIPNFLGKILAVLFCLFCILSSFTSGSMSQTNAISLSLSQSFSLSSSASVLLVLGFCLWIFQGGCDRAVKTCSALVPAMSLFYLGGCIAVLVHFRENILPSIARIFSEAFAGPGVPGISVGMFTAMRVGISRGIFTHEAGLGSASIAHSCSDCSQPVEQGFWGVFEVFCDTIVICTATALMILASGVPFSASAALDSFISVMGQKGGQALSLSVSLFALASVVSFCLYGQRCIEYLFPRSEAALFWYRLIFLIGCCAGCFGRFTTVLLFSDFLDVCLLLPNLLALVILSPEVFSATKAYYLKGENNPCLSAPPHKNQSQKNGCSC